MAATVRVGHAVGRGDAPATRIAGFTAIWLGAAFMTLMALLVVATRHWIPELFLGSQASDSAATMALASTLLALGASFFVFDGVQTIAAGALRGLHDTRVPMLLAAFSFWAIGFTSAYALGFTAGYGAKGIWVGLTIGLLVYATLVVWRFHWLTARRYLPTLSNEGRTMLAGH
jgi:MATE family multidrug resistance protein